MVSFFRFSREQTREPSGILNQFTSCVWYFCSWAHRSTISTLRIQLSGVSEADAARTGRSKSIPCNSFCFRFGTLETSRPSSEGAVQREALPVVPTQSMRMSLSFPGHSRSPRPTIWAYRASDWVGLAMITVSTLGISVPSVNTITFTRQGISPSVNRRMISSRFLVCPVTATAPGIFDAISSACSTFTAKISVAPWACSR